jgi:serine protease
LDGIYNYNSVGAGAGVDAYIVDTGVYAAHNDFQPNRATQAVNFVDGANDDCNGHGTHVAGTVGGNLYGVAKEVNIIGVKVLNCQGSGTTIGVLDGVNYVRTSAQASRRPSVANMSLGGGASSSLDSAVASAVTAGVTFAVAAGNENQDACNVSPAREKSAITTGATVVADENSVQVDTRSSYSNFGTCVSLFAPGSLITSAWIGSPSATNTISGTSMASPHVAGAAAVYLSLNSGASPAAVKSALVSSSTSGVISLKCLKRGCSDSPNKLLYSAC